jgi:drug/metabolite transporter, DME family
LTEPQSDPAWKGRLLILGAGILWSTSGFFVKAPWFDAWPDDVRGTLLAFWRSLFAVLLLAPFIRQPRWHPLLLPMLICFAVMVWSFMSAMVHGPAANAIWLQYLGPAWVLIGGLLLLGERVTRADLIMFGFCLGGVSLILAMELLGGGSLLATSLGILSGIAFAGVVLSMRSMRDMNAVWLISLCHGTTALLLSPWVVGRSEQISLMGYVALGLFGCFQMSLPYLMFARGLRSTSSPEASVLALIEPVLVPVWVWLAWHHHPSYDAPRWWTWAGASLILLGLLGRYLPLLLRDRRFLFWNNALNRSKEAAD